MRLPLDDITNTVAPAPSDGRHAGKSGHVLALAACPAKPPSARPKLLRQTSLLAFAAARSVPPPASSSTASSPPRSALLSTPVRCSPVASTSSSPPPSTPPAGVSPHPPSDEGYASTTRACMDLDCEPPAAEENEDEEDAFSDAEEQSYGHTRHVKRHRASLTSHHGQSRIAPDPAASARQAKAMARNRANLFGDISRVGGFEDIARLSEYSRGLSNHSTIARLTDRHRNDYLESFVSHYRRDVHHCPSFRSNRDYAPPFACAFSKESKRGGKKTLAVSSEEGTVCFIDAERKTLNDHGDATYFQAHNNAVFDLVWSHDDRQIATASGDQSAAVSDVERQIRLYHLKSHQCSVKQIIFDPHNPNLLATASRDGSIGLWDLRSKPNKDGTLSAVNHIRFAHDTYAKSRKGKETARSMTRSVTSIVYLQHQDNLLASGGSADGVVKLWDLRKTFSKRINPPSMEDSMDYTPASSFDVEGPTISSTFSSFSSSPASSSANSPFAPIRNTRTHGISSLCLSPDGSRLYALSTNSKIYAHDSLFLSRPLPSPLHTYSSPTMCSSSFYIRLAISPDGRYLAAGSSSSGWQASIWDLHKHSARTVYGETKKATVSLKGHDQEIGGLDWDHHVLATCGDDNLVRTWRPDPFIHKWAMREPHGEERAQHAGTWDMPEK